MRLLDPAGVRRAAACVFFLVAAGACDKDATAPLSPSIAGRWSGSAYLGALQFQADFTQSGETVGGTGQFSSPGNSGAFTISGTLRGRDVQLILTSAEYGTTTYTGRFTGANTIDGRLQNPDLDLTLERDD